MRRPPERQSRRFDVGNILAMALVVLVLAFVFSNTRHARIRFIGPEVSSPIWLPIAIAFIVGIVTGWLVARTRDRHDGDLD